MCSVWVSEVNNSLVFLSQLCPLPRSLSVRLSFSPSVCVSCSPGLVLTNRCWSGSLSTACTTPQIRVETGWRGSQSEAWKNDGGGGGEEAAHSRLCLCLHYWLAISTRNPPNPEIGAFHLRSFFLHFPHLFNSIKLFKGLVLMKLRLRGLVQRMATFIRQEFRKGTLTGRHRFSPTSFPHPLTPRAQRSARTFLKHQKWLRTSSCGWKCLGCTETEGLSRGNDSGEHFVCIVFLYFRF